MALQFECRKVALKQDRTGYVLTLSLHPDEIPDMMKSPKNWRLLCSATFVAKIL
jgi:hypothetical protein